MNPDQKILVIDDEPALLKILGKFLQKLKVKSETAENGDKGLEIFHKHPESFGAVIIDYNLPGKSSKEILTDILNENPSIKIVLSTGFSVSEISKDFAKSGINVTNTLQKPFTFKDFKDLVNIL